MAIKIRKACISIGNKGFLSHIYFTSMGKKRCETNLWKKSLISDSDKDIFCVKTLTFDNLSWNLLTNVSTIQLNIMLNWLQTPVFGICHLLECMCVFVCLLPRHYTVEQLMMMTSVHSQGVDQFSVKSQTHRANTWREKAWFQSTMTFSSSKTLSHLSSINPSSLQWTLTIRIHWIQRTNVFTWLGQKPFQDFSAR